MEDLIGEGALSEIDFEALEKAARRQALEIAAQAVAGSLNADHSDHAGPTLACACGGAAAYAGRRPKTFTTALGEMTLERAYYHCRDCEEGFFPRDQALGMEKRSLSPAVTRMTGFVAAEVSFRRSGEMLEELTGLRVGAKQVERTAKALGAEVAQDERCRVEAVPPPVSTLYLGMDGTAVPVRPSECEGRPGKQPDGSSKTREVKLVPVWWTSGPCDQTGRPRHDPDSVSYSAAIESAATGDTDPDLSAFAQRVDREARRCGFPEAQRRVILGDGAAWIWNIAGELFPGAIEIVDLFHAKGRLWDAAKAIYGPGTDLAGQWARRRCGELEAGCIDTVLKALGAHKNHQEALRCSGYLQKNRHRMRYPEFRQRGLSTSSGVVESGCKRIVGDRLKRGGMHWTVDGANAIIALKCCLLSGRFEDFWAQRSAAT